MSRELLERALEQLIAKINPPYVLIREIKAEMEKPDPDPMLLVNVWTDRGQSCFNIEWVRNPIYWDDGNYSLYTNPIARQKPLTIAEAEAIFLSKASSDDWLDLVRAIEKAHRIGDL